MDRKLTPHQVSVLRGRLKARKRGEAMAKRTAKRNEQYEIDRQIKLANEMKKHL